MRLLSVFVVSALALSCGPASGAQGHQPNGRLGTRGETTTYAEQGVILGPDSPQAAHYASVSRLRTPSAVIAALRQTRWAPDAFRTGVPSVSLHSVTEKDPAVKGVRVGVPYQAWVASVRGQVVFTGGPGSTAPSAHAKCTDVAIYDLQLSRWTDSIQSC